MTSFIPCPTCRRHVRDGEDCPFCGAELPEADGSPQQPRRGLRRAVMLAATAALATGGAIDCSSTVETHVTGGSASGAGGAGGKAQTATATASTNGGTGGTGGVLIGASSAASTSGSTSGGGFAPPYGAPPV